MKPIYRVTVRGRTLESADVHKLLARAVREKRELDRAFRYLVAPNSLHCRRNSPIDGGSTAAGAS